MRSLKQFVQLKNFTTMKKLAFMFAAAMLVMCCMIGCKQATPATIAADCVEMIKAGDYEGYAATFNVNDEEKAQLAEMFEKKGKTTLEQMGGIEGYEVVEEVIDETGEKATVKVSITYGNGKTDDSKFKFVKVNDEWKQEMNK